jgi:hypothetical protein
MPPLPWPTHEEKQTPLPPFATIANFINKTYVLEDASFHNPDEVRSHKYRSFDSQRHSGNNTL